MTKLQMDKFSMNKLYASIAEAVISLSTNPDNLSGCQQIAAALISLMPSDSVISQITLNEYILYKRDILDGQASENVKKQIKLFEEELRQQIAEARQ